MIGQIHLAIILLAISGTLAEDHRYCRLPSCPNRTHTLCKYPEPGVASRCGRVLYRGLTENEKRDILDSYNINPPRVTLYEQEDLLALQHGEHHRRTVVYRKYWDAELEEIAQRWADQCMNGEDECRNVDRFYVRQRVHFGLPIIYPVFTGWRHDDYTPRTDGLNFQGLSINDTVEIASSLLTNLMRRNENKIGCGFVSAFTDIGQHTFFICNYGIQI